MRYGELGETRGHLVQLRPCRRFAAQRPKGIQSDACLEQVPRQLVARAGDIVFTIVLAARTSRQFWQIKQSAVRQQARTERRNCPNAQVATGHAPGVQGCNGRM